MLLRSPNSLHYPITVTELHKQPGDDVERFAPLFSYYYKTTVTEGNRFGEEFQVERTYPSKYLSDHVGTLKEWRIQKGTVITQKDVDLAVIEEPCAHEVQFGGMCANCGKDMTELSYNTDVSDAERATINMIHDNVSLTVSQEEATRVEEEGKRRLLASRKLILVVDLDQTIIHATVDPTVAEWQQDTENPNHEAVKDVRAFRLVDDGPGARGCFYYIKLRPGLRPFLEAISKLYELHIYTMGTRAYAQHIADIVDPDRKIFGNRILSRDESGSLTAKNLQRLFPVDTKMVVIIDDRGDVWKWTENLIKVTPYDFFVGIGDINSSFLPKKQEPPALSRPPKTGHHQQPQDGPQDGLDKDGSEEGNGKTQPNDEDDSAREQPPADAADATAASRSAPSQVSALEQLVSMGGGDDPAVLQAQANQQDEALAAQLQDRPLLRKQRLLDEEDEAAEAVESREDDEGQDVDKVADEAHKQQQHHHQRHHLLQDNDAELQYLEQSLVAVHHSFFDEYDRNAAAAHGGRIAQLRGEKHSKKLSTTDGAAADLQIVPDVKYIMPEMKMKVLGNTVIVFSGVVPLGIDVQTSDIGLWAKTFGATISEKVSRRTTHVVAARNRTAKVRQAARRPHIKIVNTQWLFDCMSQWKRLDEGPYIIPVLPEDRGEQHQADVTANSDDNVLLSSSGEDENTTTGDEAGGNGKDLKLQTDDLDEDPEGVAPSDMDDDQSPIGGSNEDWKLMQDEMAEFLGSDADDSDTESVASTTSNLSSSARRKRKRSASPTGTGPTEEGTDDEGGNSGDVGAEEEEDGSALSQRKRRAYERSTGLKEVATLSKNNSSLPTPRQTNTDDEGTEVDAETFDEEEDEDQEGRLSGPNHLDATRTEALQNGNVKVPDEAPAEDDDGLEADLEADLEAEMEAEMRRAESEGTA
ncbi:hypothetical protein L228DRAFT_239815 [Xylona heveae TC161]|uniref:RNA polymerase II subunit A C-terminal domain phosphatase n=1 Tax=Xylona heveae (strain CBS 132557 / TC161) TaxID=1328760 RepID=A0A165G8V6_XYLHT|nr:hypothetical protein L228DRAFT_239815 [Xylona heveae TC161]KZF21883.1 hypothetical protein L228DRAFT_239815 [Xylona heveae TC161]